MLLNEHIKMAEQPAKGMECVECCQVYPIALTNYSTCHFAPLNLVYRPSGDLRARIESGPNNLFRYLDFLPNSRGPDYDVGMTHLVRTDELADATGFERGKLYLKFDEGSISRTFEDRGVAVVTELVNEANSNGAGYTAIGGTSTGNLLKAIAAAAQRNGLSSIVVVHESANPRLIEDAVALGSYVIKINSNYSKADSLMKLIVTNHPKITSRMITVNMESRPVYGEGSKTIGFEIAEQLGWTVPDNVVHPAAAGLSSSRIYKGMQQAFEFGLVQRLQTKMNIVQTEACDPIVQAWQRGEPFEIVPIQNPGISVAETLCVGNPSNGMDVLNALKASNGAAISVSDREILEGMDLVGNYTDFATEPVGGAVVAGTRRLLANGSIRPDELTVLVLTDSYRKGSQINIPGGIKSGELIEVEAKSTALKSVLEEILGITA